MTEQPQQPGGAPPPQPPAGGPETPAPAPPSTPSAPAGAGVPAELADYPVRLDVERQPEYNRLLPLVKWLLAIPNMIALVFVAIGALFAILISWFAVLITGRYPRGLFDFVVGTARWGTRLNAYVLLMTDRYPPFALADDPEQPVRFDIEYPEQVERWRPLVAWLLVIPYAIVAYFVFIVAEICVFLAFFAILFTKKFPEGLFNIALIGLRWQARANAYAYWMTTKYPPFAWG